ncbi:MAG: glycosyltransferase family 87 protein [Gaiellales bacterium]
MTRGLLVRLAVTVFALAIVGLMVGEVAQGADRGTPLAQLDIADARATARADHAISSALRQRPQAELEVEFDPQHRIWQAALRDRASGIALARVTIDDRSGEVTDRSSLPLGEFPPRTARRAAIDTAIEDPKARELAREWGGMAALRTRARLDNGIWEVDLIDPSRVEEDGGGRVIRVDVRDATGAVIARWTGHQIAWKMARGDRSAFGGDVNAWYVWIPFFVLFALITIDWTRLRSWLTVDVLAVLGIGISHEAFLRGNIDWSVPLVLVPLLWLLGRMTWIFLHGLPTRRDAAADSSDEQPHPVARRGIRARFASLALRRVPTMLLVVLCVALAGMRIGLAVEGGNVIDVGYAGVAGARLELRGQAPWGNMPADNQRGDTYGPANYLTYVPATALLDAGEEFGRPLPAAQATAIAADLGCVALLMLIGWRWISRRGAVLLAAGWLACPWTVWAMSSGVNDALVALPLLAAFALLPRAWLRGLLIGVAAMVKLAPVVVLAPLLHAGSRARLRQSLLAITGCAVAIGLGLAWVTWRLDGSIAADLRLFWDRTLAFQLERGSPFSPWGLYGWETAQRMAQVVMALALIAACWWPRARDAWQSAAGAAAALIAVQLLATHWFYLYVPWFVGFVLIVLVAARERGAVPSGYASRP